MADADKDEIWNAPELVAEQESEIQAIFDDTACGTDGIFRPVWINQDDESILSLTIEDAERLHGFLTDVMKYINEAKKRYTQ